MAPATRQPPTAPSCKALRCKTSSKLAALEQLLDVGELELDVSGPAVIALAGEGRRLHVAEERVHLLRIEPTASAHAAVAGHGGEHVVKPFRHHEAAFA